MNCKRCGAETYKNGKTKEGKQKYKCKGCGYNFEEGVIPRNETVTPKRIGMTIADFRQKHDVDYIVEKTLNKLDKGIVYEKNDIVALSGLRAGYPGLSAALENATVHKGRAGGVNYWGHPDTIEELKRQAIMT
jgi:hypothetical protein